MGILEHKSWLREKLKEKNIDKEYLLGLTIIVERTIHDEKLKANRYASKPFYLLFKDGKPTRAWLHMAELALFCKHREYNPADYVRTLCTEPTVRRRLFLTDQIPISFISPSTRMGADRLRRFEDFYLRHDYDSAY
jgi:hypothetical protein